MTTEYKYRDFFGQDLLIGDLVVVSPKNYQGLVEGKVVSYNKSLITVYCQDGSSRINYRIKPGECVRYPNGESEYRGRIRN